MFGYIRPYIPDLAADDYELYKSVYCGLCKKIGDEYGNAIRGVLRFDAAFLAIVSMAVDPSCEPVIEKKHCVFNPLKKTPYCCMGEESINFAAAFSVIILNMKLSDTIRDEKFPKARLARTLKSMTEGVKEKAAEQYPIFSRIAEEMMTAQFEIEKSGSKSIDRAADPTGIMLGKLMKILSQGKNDSRSCYDFGYFLGRWIYLIDAADDFEKDKRSNSFNPIALKFSDRPDSFFKSEEFKNYCNGLLNQTVVRLADSYRKMDLRSCGFSSIIENVIFKGMPDMQRRVIF